MGVAPGSDGTAGDEIKEGGHAPMAGSVFDDGFTAFQQQDFVHGEYCPKHGLGAEALRVRQSARVIGKLLRAVAFT